MRIEELARRVDADLAHEDVRLTMGGEPTFAGIDEPGSPQWNTEALGPLKRKLALTLIQRIQKEMAPGALLHFSQDRWYPGESLPRWAFSCYWRADGIPIWENHDWIAQEDHHRYCSGHANALYFVEALTRRLQVSASHILPAYEDGFYYLWRERRLPINVNAAESKLTDSVNREQLARVFEAGFTDPVGYVLPLRRRQHAGRWYWSSQFWFLRQERLFLIQGDLPAGHRLPLDSLPWVAPEDIEYDYETDPFSDRDELPPGPARRMEFFHEAGSFDDPKPEPPSVGTSAKNTSRPALCAEVREGRLHVFLPYTRTLSDYLDLIAAIEDTCAYLKMPVWLEGYAPPSDPRLRVLRVTPDPGVLEVNLPPAHAWDELERINNLVYSAAHRSRLIAEKFMLDGRHAATGGGNHITLGGPTPADSPLLRRPDLLRSMVAFWQNHPSLSYLFSGRFIGPTSQYPRVDEARMDSLYELEIAFGQLPSGSCPPWLVDRLFRNLLVDLTGNGHRAEFCIDKLYPPEGAGSRLGLLELRAFEMMPSPQMTLVVLLLIRALVSMFWKKPFEGKLIRWDTALHDRFLLPHFVTQDFCDVLAALREFGYLFSDDWFAAHTEFRFPKIGSVVAGGVQLELRHALEPWNVPSEDANQSGTVRYVDYSLERLQVKVSGLSASPYAIACNGRRVSLHPTAISGETVAGVRYRAHRLSSCLHPTIPVHTPLVFDIVNESNGRSIGGCSYHVANPEGPSYTAPPANNSEAASRRLARFQEFGGTPGTMVLSEEERNPNFPLTLDLRRPATLKTSRSFTTSANS
jgi:uncharacterized protein (DUF2126 family)